MNGRLVSVWFDDGGRNQDKHLYPMVMFEDERSKRFHYQVKPTSLSRLQKICRTWRDTNIGIRGWSARWQE